MTKILILSLFLLVLPSFYCYNCSISRESLTCEGQLPGCRWRDDSCTGTFPDPYPNVTSYYIDPINGSNIQSGSIYKPFKTLEFAVKALRGKDGALVILNHKGNQPVEINSQIIINSSITIRTLFEGWNFEVDLQRFNVSKKSAFKIQQGGSLTILHGMFKSAASRKGLETIFDIEDNAQLFFNNVFFLDNEVPARIVRSIGKNSHFSIVQGLYWKSSFTFDLKEGDHEIEKVEFDGINATQTVFRLNHASLNINDTTVKKGDSLFIHMEDESALQIQNLTFSSYNGNFLYAQDPSYISVNSSSFRDVRLTSPTPFIHITGNKLQTTFPYIINDTRFLDFYLQSSLILVDKSMTSIVLEKVHLSKVFQENRGYSKGICLAAENEVAVLIEKSIFTGINSTCLDLDSSTLILKGSFFDNSWASGLEKQALGWKGINWINFNGGTNSIGSGSLVKILSNSFVENKFAPKNGGALRFTGDFPGTVVIKNNSFIGNKAAVSGGAIYSENVYQKFEIEENKFEENSAHLAGAIHIMNNGTNFGEDESKVTLKDVKFMKNKSYQGPVVVILEKEKFSEENCVYEGNEELKLLEAKKIFILDEL